MIDLHTHTTASDGTLTPSELISAAFKLNLKGLAITDHDTVDGLKEAYNTYLNQEKCNQLELIPGIELSTNLPRFASDIHILGLYLNPNHATLTTNLKRIITDRNLRNDKMIQAINDAGYPLTMKEVLEMFGDSVITRAHFAKILVSKGYFANTTPVFKSLLGNGCKAYVARQDVDPKVAIQTIRDAGGVAILAHPTLYGLDLNGLYSLIDELKSYGLEGIETFYSLYTPNQHKMIAGLATRFNLVMTGGSDFHGDNKPHIKLGVGLGNLNVPDYLLEEIKARRPL